MAISQRTWRIGAVCVLLVQALICLHQVADDYTRGHIGWNSSAYHQASRNALRFDLPFPDLWYTGTLPPPPQEMYTHGPLGLYWHSTASMAVFGDHNASIHGVGALHSFLSLAALLWVVTQLWGRANGLLAATFYILFPINQIYANSANHPAGYIFWAFVGFYGYIRLNRDRESNAPVWRWLALVCGAHVMASLWDWPPYYNALFVAFHWCFVGFRRNRRAGRFFLFPSVDAFQLAIYCVVVLATFGAHVWYVRHVMGDPGELFGTASARLDAESGLPWRSHLELIPPLMFTIPILVVAAGWLASVPLRLIAGNLQDRDLIPIAFGFGGVTHYIVFKASAVVHEFWGWVSLPFVAIACSTFVLGIVRRVGAPIARNVNLPFARVVTAPLVLLAMMPLILRDIDLVPDGRRVGGSMWFCRATRGPTPAPFESGRRELHFVEQVNAWTTRQTGVFVHPGFDRFVPEPRFYVTLDRQTSMTPGIPNPLPMEAGVTDGWVFIAPVASVPSREIAQLARAHPYWEYDRYFMVDLRREGRDVRAFAIEELPFSLTYAFFVNPYEPPVRAVPSPERVAELNAMIDGNGSAQMPGAHRLVVPQPP